ncbi:DUF3307 domain-containing protein [Halarsenatibacter silvermanii]|uniref:DUF3307 domain-containing protein n=1 Tax=Halarsenatibacter silvermanii TaxID=321763 RepID=UPI00135666A6|nr:DUF3307 domain-containing protein [Halarsenatibacter silvermanii]
MAHVLADFVLQTNKLSQNKQMNILDLIKHTLIVFLTSLILTIHYFSLNLLSVLIIISVIHGLIDYSKIYLSRKYGKDFELELFLSDQLLHILLIIAVIPWFDPQINQHILAFFTELQRTYEGLTLLDIQRIGFLAIAAAVIIFNFQGSTFVVRKTLKKYKSDISSEGDRGKAIGNLERLLIILFIILGYYSLIGLLFTAKSLIRFKEIETGNVGEAFVEYYLIGSFVSIFMAISSASLLKVFYYLW